MSGYNLKSVTSTRYGCGSPLQSIFITADGSAFFKVPSLLKSIIVHTRIDFLLTSTRATRANREAAELPPALASAMIISSDCSITSAGREAPEQAPCSTFIRSSISSRSRSNVSSFRAIVGLFNPSRIASVQFSICTVIELYRSFRAANSTTAACCISPASVRRMSIRSRREAGVPMIFMTDCSTFFSRTSQEIGVLSQVRLFLPSVQR